MKCLVLVIAALSFDASANCKSLYNLAESIMKVRQQNKPIIEVYESIESVAGNDKIKELARAMIQDAYTSSLYSSEKYKRNAVVSFANKIYLECLKVKK